MNKLRNKHLLTIVLVILALFIISIILTIFTNLTFLSSLRIVFGSVYVLFLPGFVLSYVFFKKTKEFDTKDEKAEGIDWIERVALSFALSIAIVPLAVFYLNLIGLKINILNSFFTILGIIIISLVILLLQLGLIPRSLLSVRSQLKA